MALQAFREAVLEDARLAVMGWQADGQADDVLFMQDELELERLEKLLAMLIPGSKSRENDLG